jgi:hypothetical protein
VTPERLEHTRGGMGEKGLDLVHFAGQSGAGVHR